MAFLIDNERESTSRARTQEAATYLDSLGELAISVIIAQELIAGARDKRDLAGIDSLVSAYPVVHIDATIGQLAYILLKQYAKSDGLRTFDSMIEGYGSKRHNTKPPPQLDTFPARV